MSHFVLCGGSNVVLCNGCTCCTDARARLAASRNVGLSCWCVTYPPDQRCDCPFCLESLKL